jgi:hypothetical protein
MIKSNFVEYKTFQSMQLNRHEFQPFLQYTASITFYTISATLQLETLWNSALLTRMLLVNSELLLYFLPVL